MMKKNRDARKDPQPGDVFIDDMGVHMVCRRDRSTVTFARPMWKELHTVTLRSWRYYTPKNTEIIYATVTPPAPTADPR